MSILKRNFLVAIAFMGISGTLLASTLDYIAGSYVLDDHDYHFYRLTINKDGTFWTKRSAGGPETGDKPYEYASGKVAIESYNIDFNVNSVSCSPGPCETPGPSLKKGTLHCSIDIAGIPPERQINFGACGLGIDTFDAVYIERP